MADGNTMSTETGGSGACQHCGGYGVTPTGPGGSEHPCMRCDGTGEGSSGIVPLSLRGRVGMREMVYGALEAEASVRLDGETQPWPPAAQQEAIRCDGTWGDFNRCGNGDRHEPHVVAARQEGNSK
jgi:hypothetical protein